MFEALRDKIQDATSRLYECSRTLEQQMDVVMGPGMNPPKPPTIAGSVPVSPTVQSAMVELFRAVEMVEAQCRRVWDDQTQQTRLR